MRTRTTNHSISTPTAYSYGRRASDNLLLFTWTWTGKNRTGLETISDEEMRFKRYGSCSHSKERVVVPPNSGSHLRPGTVPLQIHEYEAYAMFNMACGPASGGMFPTTSFVDMTDWESNSYHAMQAMTPSFSDGGSSLVNAVHELKSFTQMFKLWNRRVPFLNDLKRRVKEFRDTDLRDRRLRREAKRVSLGYTVTPKGTLALDENLAGLLLNVQFGWIPFISDVQRFVSALERFNKRLSELRRGEGEVITRHYSCGLKHTTLPKTETQIYQEGGQYFVYREDVWDKYPTYHATARFRYQLPDMSSYANQSKAFLDALGVRRDPNIIWEATRLSFVVDWFLPIGNWLESLSADNLSVDVVLEDFCHSAGWSLHHITSAKDWGTRIQNVCTYQRSYYMRKRAVPSTLPPMPVLRLPNVKQFILGGSLLRVGAFR